MSQFFLHFPSRASQCAITFQLESTKFVLVFIKIYPAFPYFQCPQLPVMRTPCAVFTKTGQLRRQSAVVLSAARDYARCCVVSYESVWQNETLRSVQLNGEYTYGIIIIFNLHTTAFKDYCAIWVRRSNLRRQASPRMSPRERIQRRKVELWARNVREFCLNAVFDVTFSDL